MKRYVSKFAGMQMFRATGRPRIYPISLAYSVTHKCNASCKTCNLGNTPRPGEMNTSEWTRTFKSLGQAPVWITVTGGEPFMRPDIMELCRAMLDTARPALLTVVTNGTFTDKASLVIPLLAREYPKTKFVANISIDAIGPAHDRIRCLDGCFDSAVETFHALKRNQPENLLVGFHTTISKQNISSVKDLSIYLREFQPDSHMFEFAQPRAELKMQGKDIAPAADKVKELIPHLLKGAMASGISESTRRFRYVSRKRYYDVALKALETGKQPVPCFAGFASAQIGPTGDVWPCCTLARPIGNIRDAKFDFSKVWRSHAADSARKHITAGECSCPMANALFTSMMYDPASAAGLAGMLASSFFG